MSKNTHTGYLQRIIASDDVVDTLPVSFYGLKALLVIYDKEYGGYPSPKVCYFEESLRFLFEKYGSNAMKELPKLNLPRVEWRTIMTKMPVLMIGVPDDKEWFEQLDKELDELERKNPQEITPEIERYCDLISCGQDFAWDNIIITDAAGHKEVKDCWGNVLVPPMYEGCRLFERATRLHHSGLDKTDIERINAAIRKGDFTEFEKLSGKEKLDVRSSWNQEMQFKYLIRKQAMIDEELFNEPDPLLSEAVEFFINGGEITIPALQRRFGIGFRRAVNIMEQVENCGIAEPMKAVGQPRDVLIKN